MSKETSDGLRDLYDLVEVALFEAFKAGYAAGLVEWGVMDVSWQDEEGEPVALAPEIERKWQAWIRCYQEGEA